MNTDSRPSNSIATSAVISVSALNSAVAQLLERNIPLTWVSGEISNFTRASSGHWYFTLKDSAAQVRAVMFRVAPSMLISSRAKAIKSRCGRW
jgi:exodeoxyribonuclease VII large subunit